MKNKTIKFIVHDRYVNKRLDKALSMKLTNYTRSNIKKFIEQEKVKINDDIVVFPSKKIKAKDEIEINLSTKNISKLQGENISINLIYEDDDLLIVDKPPGMVVHPGAGNKNKTLVNALIYKYKKKLSNVGGQDRPGIVHRIDKDTSGLLLVAKNNYSHARLSQQFSQHTIKRKYVALIWGVLRPLSGRIETLINRDPRNRQLMAASQNKGKKAITLYKTKKVYYSKNIPRISLVEFELQTGRTHQIRVHMKYKGTSLLGEKKYSNKKIKFRNIDSNLEKQILNLNGQLLHAKTLGFNHPKKNNVIEFNSVLPDNFQKLLNLLDKLSD